MTKKTLIGCALALASMTALHSCYKEDAQELYQRQFTTSVAMADLQDQADRFNKRIGDLQLTVNMLVNREPVSKIIYAIENTDTVGAYITLGKSTIYVPFGRDGKDGKDGKDGVSPTFDVTIGGDGNWYINGQNTGKPARGPQGLAGANGTNGTNGKDACTPTFSAAQDKENTNDTRFYWTVTWCDGRTEFIKANGEKVVAKAQDGKDGKDGAPGQNGATGPQGPKGVPGEPGVISPIKKIALNKEGDKLTITTTYPDLPEVVVPLVPDLNFDIQPENAKDAKTQEAVGAQYAPDTRELTFIPGQRITIPFTKADKLTAVYAAMPANWKYKVNETEKTITVSAPPLVRLGDVEINNEVVFMARDNKGNTFSRNLKLLLPKGIFVNYFYNHYSSIPTQSPLSQYNLFDLHKRAGFKHVFNRYVLNDDDGTYSHIANEASEVADQNLASADLTEFLRKPIAYQLKKNDAMNDRQFLFQDFIYNTDSLKIQSFASAAEQAQPHDYVLTVNHKGGNAVISSSKNAVYYHPIPWETYVGETVFQSNDRSDYVTTRLHRVAQLNRFFMKNPRKWLNIPDSEPIKADKVVLSIQSTTYITSRLVAGGTDIDGKTAATRATNVVKYDAAKDLLYGEFASFPTSSNYDLKLLVEYTRANGTKIRKVLVTGRISDGKENPAPFFPPGPGGVVTFSINTSEYLYGESSHRYSSSVEVFNYNRAVQTGEITDNPDETGKIDGIRDVNETFDIF